MNFVPWGVTQRWPGFFSRAFACWRAATRRSARSTEAVSKDASSRMWSRRYSPSERLRRLARPAIAGLSCWPNAEANELRYLGSMPIQASYFIESVADFSNRSELDQVAGPRMRRSANFSDSGSPTSIVTASSRFACKPSPDLSHAPARPSTSPFANISREGAVVPPGFSDNRICPIALSDGRAFSKSAAGTGSSVPQIGDFSRDLIFTLSSSAGEGCANRQSRSATGIIGSGAEFGRAVRRGAAPVDGTPPGGRYFGPVSASISIGFLVSPQLESFGLSRQYLSCC